MSWKISRISSSLLGLLREAEADTHAPAELEHIRARMMDSMSAYVDGPLDQRPVWRKVLHAPDIQTLWYLRSDVMHLLSDHCGETVAATKLQAITDLFCGHIPAAQFASSRRKG